MQYYVIEAKGVATDPCFADRIEISTLPAAAGGAAFANDWPVHVHGSYASVEAARAAIAELFPGASDRDTNGYKFCSSESAIVALYYREKKMRYIKGHHEDADGFVGPASQLVVLVLDGAIEALVGDGHPVPVRAERCDARGTTWDRLVNTDEMDTPVNFGVDKGEFERIGVTPEMVPYFG